MKIKYIIYIFLGLICLGFAGIWAYKNFNFNKKHEVGEIVDSFNGVAVYYNGGVSNVAGRNTTADGYNLGLKYQCVEFVKRYYYEYLNHKMPDAYGNAKDFFDAKVEHGHINKQRNLIQYRNGGTTKPEVNDLLIFGPHIGNKYGHVAIISKVSDTEIEIIQQNPGAFSSARELFALKKQEDRYTIEHKRILGWLRKARAN